MQDAQQHPARKEMVHKQANNLCYLYASGAEICVKFMVQSLIILNLHWQILKSLILIERSMKDVASYFSYEESPNDIK